MNYTEQYETYRKEFERALEGATAEMNYSPAVLAESMRYSLQSGGKRIRPVLFFAMLDAFGVDYRKESRLAVSLECIHTYSLIHDDLPAMDNDDYRRGRLSNHKKFGEANAILAGDALLSYAFDILLSECGRGIRHLNAAKILSEAAGAGGMIAGQSADLLYEKQNAGENELQFVQLNKTAKLLAAPLQMAASLAERNQKETERFGLALGRLFQMTDDLLDEAGDEREVGKTLGKDKKEGKLTCIRVYGFKETQRRADALTEECLSLLATIDADTTFLEELVKRIRTRNK